MSVQLVAYYRVSTPRQGVSGLGLEGQEIAVRQWATAHGGTIVAEYQEVESGRCRLRPRLDDAVAFARAMGATLVVAKLDRLARDVRLILDLVDSGVQVAFCDLPVSGDPTTGRMLLTILAAVAEFEARRISERIKAAYAAKRERLGGKLPRPVHLTREQCQRGQAASLEAIRESRRRYHARVRPLVVAMRRQGMKWPAMAARLNELGVPMKKKGRWNARNLAHFWWRGARYQKRDNDRKR